MSGFSKWNIDKLKIVGKTTPGGKPYFQLFGYLPDGKKIRKRFETESEAKRSRREYVIEIEDEASGGEYRNTKLSREDERDAEGVPILFVLPLDLNCRWYWMEG